MNRYKKTPSIEEASIRKGCDHLQGHLNNRIEKAQDISLGSMAKEHLPSIVSDVLPSYKLPRTGTKGHVILKELSKAKGDPVSLLHLMAVSGSGSVHSQVSSLRKSYKAEIRNRTTSEHGGRHSEYSLINWECFLSEEQH